jgi:hypothetical protein
VTWVKTDILLLLFFPRNNNNKAITQDGRKEKRLQVLVNTKVLGHSTALVPVLKALPNRFSS